MDTQAAQFLRTWCLKRQHTEPMTPAEARLVAARWADEAAENGIEPAEIEREAGGSIAEFLLRTYGQAGSEISTG